MTSSRFELREPQMLFKLTELLQQDHEDGLVYKKLIDLLHNEICIRHRSDVPG